MKSTFIVVGNSFLESADFCDKKVTKETLVTEPKNYKIKCLELMGYIYDNKNHITKYIDFSLKSNFYKSLHPVKAFNLKPKSMKQRLDNYVKLFNDGSYESLLEFLIPEYAYYNNKSIEKCGDKYYEYVEELEVGLFKKCRILDDKDLCYLTKSKSVSGKAHDCGFSEGEITNYVNLYKNKREKFEQVIVKFENKTNDIRRLIEERITGVFKPSYNTDVETNFACSDDLISIKSHPYDFVIFPKMDNVSNISYLDEFYEYIEDDFGNNKHSTDETDIMWINYIMDRIEIHHKQSKILYDIRIFEGTK